MVIDHVFGINGTRRFETLTLKALVRMCSSLARQVGRFLCGLQGHQIMLHFEPNRLSLQCSLCGYESEGWEVGRPMTARRHANNPQARRERRRTLRPLPTKARLAS
jgi:hypothetical protein